AIALLSSLLINHTNIDQCPIYNCSSIINTTVYSNISSTTPILTSTSTVAYNRNLLYGTYCNEHEECTLSKNLFCQYEYNLNEKHCFCETTYFWNKYTQQCEPKKDINEICEYDNECRLDLGITCDLQSGTNIRRCRCMGEYYWSKLSNCGDLKIQDFVHC
ncbi:unnamed protein product, partial [Adineta steineri]